MLRSGCLDDRMVIYDMEKARKHGSVLYKDKFGMTGLRNSINVGLEGKGMKGFYILYFNLTTFLTVRIFKTSNIMETNLK